MRRKLLATSAIFLAIGAAQTQAAGYEVIDLGTLLGLDAYTARAINNDGTIVGNATGLGASKGFYWTVETGLKALQDAGSSYTEAYGISQSGKIIGSTYDGKSANFTRWESKDAAANRSIFDDTAGWGINNAGWVAGTMALGTDTRAVVYFEINDEPKGRMISGTTSEALGINDSNHAVGYLTEGGTRKAFFAQITDPVEYLYTPTVLFEDGVSTAYSINASDLVVGSKDNRAFAWSNGSSQILGLDNSFALAVNGLGVSAGFFSTITDGAHALVWDTVSGTYGDLNTLAGIDLTNQVLRTAYGINDSGWIVGRMDVRTMVGGDAIWQQRAFALRPSGDQPPAAVPEPLTVALSAAGLGIACAKRRKR